MKQVHRLGLGLLLTSIFTTLVGLLIMTSPVVPLPGGIIIITVMACMGLFLFVSPYEKEA